MTDTGFFKECEKHWCLDSSYAMLTLTLIHPNSVTQCSPTSCSHLEWEFLQLLEGNEELMKRSVEEKLLL